MKALFRIAGLALLIFALAGSLPFPVMADVEIEVPIDIKPDKDPNVVNVKQPQLLPVAVYDKTVDPSTTRLQGVAAEAVYYDRGTYWLVKFNTQAVLATLGVLHDGDVFMLKLTGQTFAGVPAAGYDEIVILKRGR